MDFFGIGTGIEGAVRVYCIAARRTGRTTSLINSLKPGDRVVFHNGAEAKRVKRICRDRGIDIDCIIASTKEPSRIFQEGSSQGRTIFDHSWIEKLYLERIAAIQDEIKYFQKELSGWGEAHEETKQQARELAKWTM